MRRWGPVAHEGHGLWWPSLARNKKSIAVDLRSADGQSIDRRIVREVDVVNENFKRGQLESWGLGYDDLSSLNPRLVMVRVSGFGQDGPYARRAGFGSIAEAVGGLRYISGHPEAAPSRFGISIGDQVAALFATMGTLLALRERDQSGTGQMVDVAI